MTSRRSAPEHATPGHGSGHDVGEARSRLTTALRGAALDDTATIDHNRTVLMARLMRHSDDFPATKALQALDRFTAESRADAQAGAPDRVLRQGQSGTRTARRWLHLGGNG
jgi:hypothetical protein